MDAACRLIAAYVLLLLQHGSSDGKTSLDAILGARYQQDAAENKATNGDLLTGGVECASAQLYGYAEASPGSCMTNRM